MKSALLLVAALGLAAPASAQSTLTANTSWNLGLTPGMPGLFFDFTAGAESVTVTELMTASNHPIGSTFDIEIFTFVGTGLGGSASTGPGSATNGWTSLGVSTATQGTVVNGQSQWIDIPDITVPAGQTVGVALVYLDGGVLYFSNFSPIYQTFSNSDLTITTGDARTEPFAPSGTFYSSRGFTGAVRYELGSGTFGTNYCMANPNSTGSTGVMSASGSVTVSANNFVAAASNLPPNQFGIFLTSRDQGFVPNANGTSNGNICLGGTIGRFFMQSQILASGSSGAFSLQLPLTSFPQGNGFVSVMPGETWNFQAWHRDGNGAGSNFTDGLTVQFE